MPKKIPRTGISKPQKAGNAKPRSNGPVPKTPGAK
jgi:hypothetical protein